MAEPGLARPIRAHEQNADLDRGALQEQYRTQSGLRHLAAAFACAAAILGLLGLIGHVAQYYFLSTFNLGYKHMVPSGGLALILLGLGIAHAALARRPSISLLTALAAPAMLIALVRLAEAISGADWNSSNLFLSPPLLPLAPDETPASPQTAVALACASLWLLLAHRQARPGLLFTLGGIALIIGAGFLLAYAYRSPLATSTLIIPIAFPAALGLTLAGAATIILTAAHEVAVRKLLEFRRAQNEAQLSRLAAEMKTQRDQFQAIVSNTPAALLYLDGQTLIVKWNNDQYTHLLDPKFHDQDLTGLHLTHFVPVAEEEGVAAPILQAAEGQLVGLPEFEYRGFERGPSYFRWMAVPVERSDGHGYDVLVMSTDITAQVQARQRIEALSEETQRRATELETVINSIADAVVVYDSLGRIIRHNGVFRKMTGYGLERADMPLSERMQRLQMRDADGHLLEPGQTPPMRALIGETISGDVTMFDNSNGEQIIALMSAAPLYDPRGSLTGAVVTMTDITAMHQAQEELRAHRDHLEQLVAERTAALEINQQRLRALAADLSTAEQRERQRLASAIHDEVAQTLGAIKLHLQVLKTYPAATPVSPMLDQISTMVDDAVRQSREIMMELSPPILQQQGLAAALRWWAQQVQEKHALDVVVNIHEPVQRLDADVEAAMFQMSKELLQNTVKHAQAENVTITVVCDPSAFEVQIADDGVGFDPANVEANQQGGFGLFSIRERASYLGGEFTIDSAPGEGTRSIIRIPIACQLEELPLQPVR